MSFAPGRFLPLKRNVSGSVWIGNVTLRLHGPEGVEEQVEVGGPFAVGSARALHQAAVAGLGIALLPSVITADDIARGALVPILPQYSRSNQSLCVVYPSHRQVSPAVKVFVASVMRTFEQAFALHGS